MSKFILLIISVMTLCPGNAFPEDSHPWDNWVKDRLSIVEQLKKNRSERILLRNQSELSSAMTDLELAWARTGPSKKELIPVVRWAWRAAVLVHLGFIDRDEKKVFQYGELVKNLEQLRSMLEELEE